MKTKGDQQNFDPSEDRLSPTPLQNNQPDEKRKEDFHFTNKEVEDYGDKYSKIGGKAEDFFAVQKMLREHKQEKAIRDAKKQRAHGYHATGRQVGLDHPPAKEMEKNYDHQQQISNNKTMKEMKGHYKENNSLSKTWKDDVPSPSIINSAFNRNKNKGMDRTR